jgi:hypothetical protein
MKLKKSNEIKLTESIIADRLGIRGMPPKKRAAPASAAPDAKKKKGPSCSISKEDFMDHAEHLDLVVGDKASILTPKEFTTGSFGWGASTKLKVNVHNTPVQVQITVNATVLGSKNPSEVAEPGKFKL